MKTQRHALTFHGILLCIVLNRRTLKSRIKHLLDQSPCVALLGPRQCGKTTVAKDYAQEHATGSPIALFDLEDPESAARLDQPKLALEPLRGLVIIDEVQRRPELFPLLRVLLDRTPPPAKFLLLGSASRDLIVQASETLAGRVAFIEVTPFHLGEIDAERWRTLWVRGGYPRAYLSPTDQDASEWRRNYIRTFLERDLGLLGFNFPPESMRRFWRMLAHYHGQTMNSSELARSLGVADTTVRRYFDALVGTFMIRRLNPWSENLKKREVKSPKVYFRDSGLFHELLHAPDLDSMMAHPKLGASWEGFAMEQVLSSLGVAEDECYFWGVHGQSELDLFLVRNGKRLGFEFKYEDAPRMTKSIASAISLLRLDSVTVVYPGLERYRIDPHVEVRGLRDACE